MNFHRNLAYKPCLSMPIMDKIYEKNALLIMLDVILSNHTAFKGKIIIPDFIKLTYRIFYKL